MIDTAERDRRYAARCPECGDTGAVIVPHPVCVDRSEGRVKPPLLTTAVACPCPAGGRSGLSLTYASHAQLIGGLDGLALLAEHEDDRRERLRHAEAELLTDPR